MSSNHQDRMSLGAYALGTLEPADQQRVEEHLASCPDCLAELAELESVVPALASLSAEEVAAPAPSADLFARIVGAVDDADAGSHAEAVPPSDAGSHAEAVPYADADAVREPSAAPAAPVSLHRRRSTRWLAAVAAAVVLLAGAATGIGLAVWPHRPAATVASASASGVSLRVSATDQGSGTRLELTAKGLPAHEHCHLVAVAADGSRHDAGSWNATYDGAASLTESTDVSRAQLRGLTLYGSDNAPLLTVRL